MSKGARDREGALACLKHVITYTAITTALGALVWLKFDLHISLTGFIAGQAVSAITHYLADRRYTLAWLASKLGKTGYYNNGGAAALDQS
ncbi:hypothetical protein ACIA49_21835 [Kribbella sp. NPDC051587]|uniref:hypothetical protein n=1 Tax=Kribbella sp. NPDC051587 TaxID=3364119 RepID=UPI0037A9CB44